MEADLLHTKLFRPPMRAGYVSRPDLVARLRDGWRRGCVLTLVSAPAGYGKTSLIVEWLAGQEVPTAWVSLGGEDNEPTRFYAYLLAALQQVDPRLGSAFGKKLQRPRLPPIPELIGSLINSFAELSGRHSSPGNDLEASAGGGHVLLVLDDFHTINEPAIHEALDFLLEHAPPALRLVIITRQDPLLALARLRARGQLLEIRQEALRFSQPEAAALLAESLGQEVDADQVATIRERTEGWVAGLQLAALSLQGLNSSDRERFVAGFSGRHQFVLDYLTDEVLRRQPASVQAFLLHTAVLEQLSGPLCDAVLGADVASQLPAGRSQAMLEQLDRANLFTAPLDEERRWYRYHHLFAELLRARLNEKEPDMVTNLHQRAAGWHEQNGSIASAVHHALLTGNLALAADLVERAIKALSTWSSVEVNTVLEWIHALPDNVRYHRPWLMLFDARALYVTGQMDAASRTLKLLEAWLERHPDAPEADRMRGLMRADYASYAVVRGDANEAIAYASVALDQVAVDDRGGKVRPAAILGLAHLRIGNVNASVETLTDAVDGALASGQMYVAIPLYCNLAEARLLQGRLNQAQVACDRAAELAQRANRPMAVTGFVGLQLGKVLYERNELAKAERHVREALALIEHGGITENFGSFYGVLAQILQALGQTEEATAMARRAVELALFEGIERMIILAQAYQARVWLAQGAIGRAEQWGQSFRNLAPAPYLREFEELTLTRLDLAQARSEPARIRLEASLPRAEAAGRHGHVLEMNALLAVARQQQGDKEGALAALTSALDLAEPEGYRRVFLEAGPVMTALLARAGRAGHYPGFVAELLDAGSRDASLPAQTGAMPGQALLIEPLTERELEVLALLAEGLSNPEIAARLVLSVNTVRTHTYNIYGKLEVHNRTQAVTRARELALLPDGE